MHSRTKLLAMSSISLGLFIAAAPSAWGQATQRAAFVGNNGNLEGSVTAYTFNPDNSLHFVNKVVTGTRTNINDPCPGCNAYSISITPDGQYLAVGHASGSPRGLSVLSVAADASVSLVTQLTLSGNWSPLSVRWIDNRHIAVSYTDSSGVNNGVGVYTFNPAVPNITFLDFKPIAGGFTGSLEVHPTRQFLYAQTSNSPYAIWEYQINANGSLTFLNSFGNAYYPLGPGISADGTKLYCAGGISGGSHIISGFTVNPATGALAPMAGTPFNSPGNSPKQTIVTSDNAMLLAAHGSDSSTRSFFIDQASGALTYSGFSFAVGIQGSLGEIATLDNLVLVCDRDTINDGVKGLYSLTLNPNGSFTQNGSIVDSQGTVGPNTVVTWKPPAPPCPADVVHDGAVNVSDLLAVINGWGSCPQPCPPNCAADINHDCAVNVSDLLAVINGWGSCP